jgi:hypothetical protein
VTGPTPEPSIPDAPTGSPRIPGERRLAHPPSDRYRVAEPSPPLEDPRATATRGVVLGSLAALAGAGLITFLGGVLAVSSGLIVAAIATGWAIAVAIRVGAAGRVTRARRLRVATALAVLAVVLAQVGLWVYSRSEGGVLGPLDYLAEVFGLLVPIQLVAASIAAWVTAR